MDNHLNMTCYWRVCLAGILRRLHCQYLFCVVSVEQKQCENLGAKPDTVVVVTGDTKVQREVRVGNVTLEVAGAHCNAFA